MNREQFKSKMSAFANNANGDGTIVSCYLDNRDGISESQSFVRQQLHADSLDSVNSTNHQEAVDKLCTAIEELWNPDSGALALYLNTQKKSLELTSFTTSQPIEKRLSISRTPDLRPLMPLLNPEENAIVLTLRNELVQLFDVRLGALSPVAWALAPHLAAPGYITVSSDQRGISRERLKRVCASLIGAQTRPISLAASAEGQERLRDWLPSTIGWRLDEPITLSAEVDDANLAEFITAEFCQRRHARSNSMLARLLQAIRIRGRAVAGSVAALTALQQRQASEVIITEQALDQAVGHCETCGTAPLLMQSQTRCVTCEKPGPISVNHAIEACWMAFRQNLPVYRVSSEDLQYLGGMGCTLTLERQSNQLPHPRPTATAGLDLVA